MGLETAPDEEVLHWANGRGRALLTHAIGFGRRAMRDAGLAVGVVLFRKAHRGLDESVRQIRAALEVDLDARPPFLLVVDTAVDGRVTFRIRNLHFPPYRNSVPSATFTTPPPT